MQFVTSTSAAAMVGPSFNAVSAVSDILYVTHGWQSHQALKVGQTTEPRWCDRSAVNMDARSAVKLFAYATGNNRFNDITSVTHD